MSESTMVATGTLQIAAVVCIALEKQRFLVWCCQWNTI